MRARRTGNFIKNCTGILHKMAGLLGGTYFRTASGTVKLLEEYPGSVAGYSLRSIGSGPVVKLRRASDSAEKDFAAGELVGSVTGSELLTNGDFATDSIWTKDAGWSITGGQASYDGTGSGTEYLRQDDVWQAEEGSVQYYIMEFTIVACDDFSQAGTFGGVGSTRSFQSSYGITEAGTYSVIRRVVVPSSNNNSDRFRFFCKDAHVLTIKDVSLRAYTPTPAESWNLANLADGIGNQATDSAYVTTWYDQSENGFDASQSTLTQQPLLISAGVTNTDDACGKPAIRFELDRDTHLMTGGWSELPQPLTQFGIGQMVTDSSSEAMASGSSSSARCHISYSNTSGNFALYGGQSLTSDVEGNLNRNLFTGMFSGSSSVFRMGGVVVAEGDAGSNSIGPQFTIGAQQGGDVTNWDGDIQEVVVYGGNQDSSFAGIEGNMADGWCVPYPTQPIVSDNMPTPAAGYSLRSLTGNNSETVVRLRRASDSSEQDFTAGEVTDGTAEAWSQGGNAYVTTLYDQAASNEQVFYGDEITGTWYANGDVTQEDGLIRFTNVTNSSTCLSSAITGDRIPVGTYRVEVDYSGCTQEDKIAVQLGGENVTIPVGSGTVTGVVTVEAADSGRVNARSINSQAGQSCDITGIRIVDIGNPATQSTLTAQPKLITAGVVEVDNQRPTMVFDGVDDTLTVTMNGFAHTDSFYVMGTDDTTFYLPTNRDEGAGWAGWLADDGSASTTIIGGQYNSGSNAMRVNGADQTPTTRDDVHALLGTDTQLLVSDIHATTATWTAFNWGADYASAEYGGRLQEWIIYGSDQSANRQIIETNINNHYGIIPGVWYDSMTWDDNGTWQN